jgi:hypothetical protein
MKWKIDAPYPDILDLAHGRGHKYRAECAAFDAEFQRKSDEDRAAMQSCFDALSHENDVGRARAITLSEIHELAAGAPRQRDNRMSDQVNDASLVMAEGYKRDLDALRLRVMDVTQDVQAWISAGNFMVMGYPAHDHLWKLDDGVALTNPPIRHRRCELCGLVQERYEYEYPDLDGRVGTWHFDEFENIGKLVNRLSALVANEKTA